MTSIGSIWPAVILSITPMVGCAGAPSTPTDPLDNDSSAPADTAGPVTGLPASPSGDAAPEPTYPRPAAGAATAAKSLKCEERDSGWGCTDNGGNTVIPFEHIMATPFSEAGITIALHPQHGHRYIDATGQVLYAAVLFDNGPDPLVDGRARVLVNDKIGYVRDDLTIVIPPAFDAAMPFADGKAKVCEGCDPKVWSKDAPPDAKEGTVFFIDKDGNRTE